MRILTIDLGTHTGWAARVDACTVLSGVQHFTPRRFEGGGMRFLRFSSWLAEIARTVGSVQAVYANNVLEHVPDLVTLMGNCLKLLKTGGEFRIEVPYEHARAAWQDPTHVRALNENSWSYYTDWFWYLGWYEHRFEIADSTYLDERVQPCEQAKASFMRLTLRKIETTPAERMHAQAMQPDNDVLKQTLKRLNVPW